MERIKWSASSRTKTLICFKKSNLWSTSCTLPYVPTIIWKDPSLMSRASSWGLPCPPIRSLLLIFRLVYSSSIFSIIESNTELICIATSLVGASINTWGFLIFFSRAYAAFPVKMEPKQIDRNARVLPDPLNDWAIMWDLEGMQRKEASWISE